MIVEIVIRNDEGDVVATQSEPFTPNTDAVGIDLSRGGAIVLDARTFLRGWEWKPRLVRLPSTTEISA